jgi:hypothetical protein
MEILLQLVKFVHVLSFAFMSVPLFNLIAVNERARLGSAMSYNVDHYLENVIGGLLLRCYAFQLTVLLSGLALVFWQQLPFWNNWVLLTKVALFLAIVVIHNYAYFSLQRPINRLLAQVKSDPVPEAIAAQIRPLRVRRKKLAGFCLFFVLVTILLGLQVYVRFSPILTAVLIVVVMLFTWRAFKSLIPYGWT